MAVAFRPEAVCRLESARASVLSVAQSAYRDPAEAARRFFVLAEAGRPRPLELLEQRRGHLIQA
jgi:hypothetical protein